MLFIYYNFGRLNFKIR